jgi:hypothetical protein
MTCKDCEKPYVYNLQCKHCIARWLKLQNRPALKLKAAGAVLAFKNGNWSEETFKWAESKCE